MLRSVGSGTGPETLAPVRSAVSTISRAARSMASWSYAFSLIRIFCAAIAAISKFVSLASFSMRADTARKGRGPIWWGAAPGRMSLQLSSPPATGGKRASRRPALTERLLDDLGDDSRADRPATLADGEPQALVHGDRLDQLDRHLDVVSRHHHLRPLGEVGDAGHVGGAEVELRPVAREERRVTSALLLLQAVDLGFEFRVRGDRARLAENLAALDLLALGASQQGADVVAGLPLVEQLAEHLDAGDDRGGRVLHADDLDFVTAVDDPLLDAAGCDRAAAGDREDVLDRHEEGLVELADRLRDVGVEGGGQLEDGFLGL